MEDMRKEVTDFLLYLRISPNNFTNNDILKSLKRDILDFSIKLVNKTAT